MEEKKTKARFEMVEAATQMGWFFKDNTTEEVMTMNELLLKMANDLQEIKKAVA